MCEWLDGSVSSTGGWVRSLVLPSSDEVGVDFAFGEEQNIRVSTVMVVLVQWF